MENKEIDLIELVKVVWKHKIKVVKYGIVGVVVGIIIAISIPREFVTVVQIASEGKDNRSSMGSMSSLASLAGVNLGAGATGGITDAIYPEIVKSSPFLLEFVDLKVENEKEQIRFYDYLTTKQKGPWWGAILGAPFQLIGWIRSIGAEKETKEEVVDLFKPSAKQTNYIKAMQGRVSVVADKKTKIINISVTMQDPLIAAVVADSLVVKLQQYMTDYRTSKARQDLLVSQKMCDQAQQKYYQADAAYASAQDQNRNLISKSAQVKVERLSSEKNLAFSVYQQLATQVAMNRIKLQEDTPIATVIEPASVSIRAVSPKKPMIVIAFAFLAGFVAVGTILFKELMKKNDESE